ncbi:uncharacterized protein LAESUDRAFT_760619 [Laetiporus sulphureus 93-53]|uniref:Uncharacterized protein n=1 Tax=Laetiporus sulphureus 93-53 TaxID=1314785 RepID=A0A165DM57_9APHY|nr:uncharacterized protein LAESUDRAFT_760619 [Laetiporus sulphureus 93-53]KZT05180.1 hypothetical protein LAESUDRAFT_760619 [Laetiporus sulphureus 93-53]
MASALNLQVSISLRSNDIDSSANKRVRARSTAPTSYQPPPPSFTTGFSPLKSILQASHIRHARTPSPDHNGLRASKRMQNTAMGQRRRRRRASRWVSGSAYVGQSGRRAGWDVILGEPPSLSPFYSAPVRALASLTITACKHAVSFVRRYRLPRTQRDESIAYGGPRSPHRQHASRTRARSPPQRANTPCRSFTSTIFPAANWTSPSRTAGHALLTVNVTSRMRTHLHAIATVMGQSECRAGRNGFSGESPLLSLASFTNMTCLHAVSFVRRYRIPRTERDDFTAYGHAIIAVNVASQMRAHLQGRPTVASGAAAEGRGGDLMERVGGRERT